MARDQEQGKDVCSHRPDGSTQLIAERQGLAAGDANVPKLAARPCENAGAETPCIAPCEWATLRRVKYGSTVKKKKSDWLLGNAKSLHVRGIFAVPTENK